MLRNWLTLAAVALAALCPALARANETDQFTLPPGGDFVDLGDYFSKRTYTDLTEVVGEANAKIRGALASGSRGGAKSFQSPSYIAGQIYKRHGLGFAESDRLERMLHSDEVKKEFPGRIVAYKAPKWIFSGSHLPIDPRNLFLVARASTIKVYGVYMGTDKIGHFHQIGYSYYKKAIRDEDAKTHEDAAQRGVHSWSKGFISEGSIVGALSAGVYSNADLAANYVGMKFYFNLTDAVRLQGKVHPPLLVRNGEYWALADHVRRGAPIFKPFVSEHFNEALNPCVYTPGLRGRVAKKLRQRAATILAFYADEHGQPRPRQYFEDKVKELWTYHGEDYGHSDSDDNLVTIAGQCFENAPALRTAAKPGDEREVRVNERRSVEPFGAVR